MTYNAKVWRSVIYSMFGAIPFGIWQRSTSACIFCYVVLMLFSGLVIAIQHDVVHAIEDLKEK